MDIVVTIPRSESSNIKKEDDFVSKVNNQAVQFWSIGKRPKELYVNDRVYFVENGFVTCYHKFLGFVDNPVCEVTGRHWSGLNLLLECPCVNLSNPIPKKGFQGFRYIERLEP